MGYLAFAFSAAWVGAGVHLIRWARRQDRMEQQVEQMEKAWAEDV